MKLKKILIFGIVLLVILQIVFIFGQENEISFGEQGTIKYGEGTDVYPGEKAHITFKEGGAGFAEINGNKFGNINHGFITVYKNGEIESARFFTNDKGGEYNFNGNIIKVPPNSEIAFFISNGNVFPQLPEGTEIKNVKGLVEFRDLENIKFWKDGGQYIFSGDLRFRENGQMYLTDIDSLKFKGVEITPSIQQETDIFLDGKLHDESKNYLSFGKNDFRAKSSGSDSAYLSFDKDFQYFDMEEGDTAGLDIRNSEIVIQNRDEFGLGSLLRAKGEEVNLFNGKEIVTLSENKFFLSNRDKGKSFPLEFINQNSNEKILIDGLGRINVVREVEEGFGRFQRVRYEFLTEESVERLIGKEIVLKGLSENEKIGTLQNLKNYYSDLSPETKKSFDKIEILSSEEFDKTYPYFKMFGASPGAFAMPTGTIVMKNTATSSLKHEAAHERHFDLGLISGFSFGGEFNKKWSGVAGPYDKVVSDEYRELYKDSPDIKPRHGYTSIYGGKNIHEDVATFVDEANNPRFFKNLLSEDNEWHDIYRKKLDLLHEYKFITNKEYSDILRGAGLQ